MKINDDAFTMMETMLTVTIIIIISSVFVIACGSAIKGASQSVKAVKISNTLTGIDHFIRVKTNETHIPYWAHYKPYIDTLTAQLYQSEYGSYIKSVNIVGKKPSPRGIEVIYTVNNHEVRTVAILPTIAVLDEIK